MAHDVARAAPHKAYQWVPTQSRQHACGELCSPGGTYFNGTFVNTLSADLDLQGAVCQEEEIFVGVPRQGPANFRAKGRLSCCLVEDDLVLCRGEVVGDAPAEYDPHQEDDASCVGQLPEGARPRRPLRFAALARALQRGGSLGDAPQLVMLDVGTDGWIRCLGKFKMRATIDISAIRFCISRGLSLADEVRLHTCDVAGRRFAVLQGLLAPRALPAGPASLAVLPLSCRPGGALPFVAAGSRPGRFHLVVARPGDGQGTGGELTWADSKWQGVDSMSLSGVIFEVCPEVLQFSLHIEAWTSNRRVIAISDFQEKLVAKYGCLEYAWKTAFNSERHGIINFTAFTHGCKAGGYKGNISGLWAMLDVDRSGEISFNEFALDVRKDEGLEDL